MSPDGLRRRVESVHRLFLGLLVALFIVGCLVGCESGSRSASDATKASRAPVTRVWPKVTRLRDGGTISVSRAGVVTERDPHGALLAMSDFRYCGPYVRWVGFMSSIQAAVEGGSRGRIAELVGYPLRWNHDGKSTEILNRHSLLANYTSIFSPSVVAAIRRADPRALFCHEAGVMLGDGLAWGEVFGNSFATGRYVLVTINSGS